MGFRNLQEKLENVCDDWIFCFNIRSFGTSKFITLKLSKIIVCSAYEMNAELKSLMTPYFFLKNACKIGIWLDFKIESNQFYANSKQTPICLSNQVKVTI